MSTKEAPKSLTRELIFDLSREIEIDEATRTVKNVSVSSDEPYDRWFGTEILSHKDGAIDLTRAKKGATPLLYNHDRSALLGKAMNPRIEGGKLCMDFKFSTSAVGKQALDDLRDGILTECSIGYEVEKWEIDEKTETYTATKWCLMEASLVTIPADATVGVGRSKETEKPQPVVSSVDNPQKKEQTPAPMNPLQVRKPFHEKADEATGGGAIDLGAERKKWETELSERAEKINGFADKFQERHKVDLADIRKAYLFGDKRGASFDEFSRDVMVGEFKAVEVPANFTGKIGANDKETKRFSVVKALRELYTDGALSGLEKEMCDATQKELKRTPGGERAMFVPVEVEEQWQRDQFMSFLMRSGGLTRAQSSAFAAGGATIAQEMQGLIEFLRNRTVLGQMGITVLSGLVGDLVFPVQTGGATAYWVSETGALTDSEATFGNKTMTPKRLGATIPLTRQILAQSSISMENWVRNEIDIVTGLKADAAGLQGTGSLGEPLGIANTTGINQTVTFSGAAEWPDVVEFETGIVVDNADIGTMAFCLSSATVGKWKTILRSSVAGALYLVLDDMTANGYKVARTNQITGNIAFFGVWSQLMRGIWASRELIVDPYSLKKQGQIEVTSNEFTDFLVRQPLSFNVSTDSAAQ